MTAMARELGVSFDWVAQRLIAARTRRDVVASRRSRRRPPELDSDEWLSEELAAGAGVRDLSRRLHVSPSTVRNALRHYAARRAQGGVEPGAGARASDPERRFTAAAGRAERASVALERASVALERARRTQASAVIDLQRSGLTVPAIADRLGVEVNVVEALLALESSEP